MDVISDHEVDETEEVGDPVIERTPGSGDPVDCSSEQDTIADDDHQGEAKMAPLNPVEEPYEDQEFDTQEAAYAFYNGYASRVGFEVRRSKLARSRSGGSPIRRVFVCSKEGFKEPCKREKKRRSKEETRIGCEARILVGKASSGKWVLRRFVKEHNHPLKFESECKDQGVDDQLQEQEDKVHEKLSKQLEEEKKISAKRKRQLELLCDSFDEYDKHMTKKMQQVLDDMKKIEAEEKERKAKRSS